MTASKQTCSRRLLRVGDYTEFVDRGAVERHLYFPSRHARNPEA